VSGLGLLALTATVAADPCAAPWPAITAFRDRESIILAAVPEGSPLFDGIPDAPIPLWPIAATNTSSAALLAKDRKLSCSSPILVAPESIVSPIDRAPLRGSAWVPVMAPERGHIEPGALPIARLAEVIDHSTGHKDRESVLPVYAESAVGPVPGGAAMIHRRITPSLGEVAREVGPIVRLGVEAPALEARPAPADTAALRDALDDQSAGQLAPAKLLTALPGYGAIERELVDLDVHLDDAGSPVERFFLAHGLAFGLPLISYAIGFFGTPRCVVMCQELVFPFDRSFRDSFNQRDPDDIQAARTRLYVLEGLSFAVAGLTMLAPSSRHGNLSRLEILEDILIIGEGAMVALTTPALFRNRIGRNRPLTFHPILGPQTEGAERIGPPFMAFSPNYAGGLMGAATTLLVIEDAPAPYVWATAAILSGLGVWMAISEIEAGLAFPADVPLSFVYGAINGAGVALWHQIFWRGWPGGERGDLPLRLHGASLVVDEAGTQLSVGGAF
jgi:hypothetical protein